MGTPNEIQTRGEQYVSEEPDANAGGLPRTARGIVHEVNNLLTVILGNLELLSMRAEERGEVGEADKVLAEAALGAGEKASALMLRLLASALPDAAEGADLAAILGRLELPLRQALGNDVRLAVPRSETLWRVSAETEALETAILQMTIQAEVGVTIEAANVSGLDTGDQVAISVAAVSWRDQPDFSLAHRLAERCGGRVVIEDISGHEMVVRLLLPRLAERDKAD
jgi:signal transduction histidine kinase